MTEKKDQQYTPAKKAPGRLEVISGSMFSGKTEELIRRLRRAQFARQKVEIFKCVKKVESPCSQRTKNNGITN